MKIEGYQTCTCGAQVPDQLAWQTNGVCLDCFMAGAGRYLRVVELRHEARTHSIRLKSHVKRGPKKSNKTKHVTEHAKRAALRRLRSWVPDLYDIAYAIERQSRGLAPLALRKPPGHFVDAVATAAERGVYAAADPGGVSGAQDQEADTAAG